MKILDVECFLLHMWTLKYTIDDDDDDKGLRRKLRDK